jgi:hypothetical protein
MVLNTFRASRVACVARSNPDRSKIGRSLLYAVVVVIRRNTTKLARARCWVVRARVMSFVFRGIPFIIGPCTHDISKLLDPCYYYYYSLLTSFHGIIMNFTRTPI